MSERNRIPSMVLIVTALLVAAFTMPATTAICGPRRARIRW